MAKDPAVLFYTSDFLTGTSLFSFEQKGKYITLLCLQHQKGHLSEKDMLHICNSYDEDIWGKFVQDADGKFYNERMELETNRRKKYSESRAANRRKPEPKEVKVSIEPITHENHMLNISDSYVEHMENEIEIENKDVIKEEKEFEKFWSIYDKKRSPREKTLKKWLSLKQSERDAIFQTLPDYIESTPDKQFRKDPLTYLNQRAWEFEIVTASTPFVPTTSTENDDF